VDFTFTPTTTRAFPQDVMDNLNFALQQVVNVGTGTTAQGLGRPSAGKTGTTDDNMSAWYVGYTPQLATAVMMAKSDEDGNMVTLEGTGGMYSVTGGSFPARIWTAFNRGALEGLPVETFPMPGTWVGSGSIGPSPTVSASVSPSALPSDVITPSEQATSPTPTRTPKPTQSTAPTPAPTSEAPELTPPAGSPSQRVVPPPVPSQGSP